MVERKFLHVLILNIHVVFLVFVSCPLITRTSERHVSIYLLLYFSGPFLSLNKKTKSTTASEKREKKNAVTRFLVTPLRRYAVTPLPVTPLRVLLATGYTHNMLFSMQILKDGAIADGGLYFLIYGQFLLQRRLSDYMEQYNEPPRYRSHRNFAKWIFVVQIYQTDAQYGGSRITNLAERHWRNDWRETLLDSQDIISMLHCTLVMRIFRIEGLYLIITRVVMFGHAFDHWRDFDFSVGFE